VECEGGTVLDVHAAALERVLVNGMGRIMGEKSTR